MILEEDRDFFGFVLQRHMKDSTVQAQSREILCFMEDSFQQDFPDIIHILTQQDTKHLYWLFIILGHRFDGICNISLAQLCLHTPLHTYRIARHNHTNTTRKAGEKVVNVCSSHLYNNNFGVLFGAFNKQIFTSTWKRKKTEIMFLCTC